MFVRQPLGFLRRIRQYALAFIGERKIDRSRNLLADGCVSFDLLANGFNGGVRPQKSIGKRLVLTQQAEQEMLGLNIRRAKLAGFIPCKKYDATCFFCITIEHVPPRKTTAVVEPQVSLNPNPSH